MIPRLRLYDFLATPAHAYLWLVAQLLGIDFSYRIADVAEPPPVLVELTPKMREHIEWFAESQLGYLMICPRCGKKYHDHEIGGNDPCVS